MKHIYIFLLLLSTIINFSIAQDTTFYNENWDPVIQENATYFGFDTKNDSGFYRTDYYINNNQLQMEGFFYSIEPEIKGGEFIWYAENGNKINSSYFIQNIEISKKYYHPTGSLESSDSNHTYTYYHENGKTKAIYKEVNDSTYKLIEQFHKTGISFTCNDYFTESLKEEYRLENQLLYINKAIHKCPDSSEYYFTRSFKYITQNRKQKAIKDLETYLSINNTPASSAYWFKANLNFELGNLELAKNDYNKVFELDTSDYYTLLKIAHIEGKLNNNLNALNLYQKAIPIQINEYLKIKDDSILYYKKDDIINDYLSTQDSTYLYLFKTKNHIDCINNINKDNSPLLLSDYHYTLIGNSFYELKNTNKACLNWSKSNSPNQLFNEKCNLKPLHKIDFEYTLKPELEIHQHTKSSSRSETKYSGPSYYLNKITSKGIPNPTILLDSSSIRTTIITGKTINKKTPLNISYNSIKSTNSKQKILQGLNINGEIINDKIILSEISNEEFPEDIKEQLLTILKQTYTQLSIPKKKMKIGQKLIQETPFEFKIEGKTLHMNLLNEYELITINYGIAELKINSTYTIVSNITDKTLRGTGTGDGFILYDIENKAFIDYRTDVNMDIETEINNITIKLNQSSLMHQRSYIIEK